MTRVSDEHLARLLVFRRLAHEYASKSANEHMDWIDKKLSGKTIREKEWMANKISEMRLIDNTRESSEDEDVLRRAVNVLAVLGYTDLARDLGVFSEKISRAITLSDIYLNEIIDGAVKKNRSDAASGGRHNQKDEIMDVIYATWKVYPWGSKTRMIKYILSSYRVVEKTLKDWIKNAGYGPTQPVQNKNFSLVIPSKWKK